MDILDTRWLFHTPTSSYPHFFKQSVICYCPFRREFYHEDRDSFCFDTCSRINCRSVTACNGRISKGLCGCCDVCIVTLREGEVCNPYPFLGLPPHSECGFNLVCSKHTMTCIKPLNLFVDKCNEERSKAMLKMLPGAFLPRCSADGSYAPVQCRGSVCKCVTKDGEEINGFQGRIHDNDMNCNCARDQSDYQKEQLLDWLFWSSHQQNKLAQLLDKRRLPKPQMTDDFLVLSNKRS
ncbi:unnamed protein product [Acanthosepion pharaonis]|uniref:Thyroglobulin type-1 domain-containing protein n=1 Tax=Acanthosepion pharaonis TaxID=158019 RepID=A0A812BCS3_ACAPH|nr:unnamed protein product [Sepia pharaonis]